MLNLNTLTLAESDALRALLAARRIAPLIAWLAQHGLTDEEARRQPVGLLGQLRRWLDTDDLVPMDEQRAIYRWHQSKDKKDRPVPRWFALMTQADGNALEAQRMEHELHRLWYHRLKVYQRGGPEGEYLSGGPTD